MAAVLKGALTVLLLCISNAFMTTAWYLHLKFKSWPIYTAIFISWGIAFFEYAVQVPANRVGHISHDGPFTAPQLKVIQEFISLVAFGIFSTYVLKERLRWADLGAFLLIFGGVLVSLLTKAASSARSSSDTVMEPQQRSLLQLAAWHLAQPMHLPRHCLPLRRSRQVVSTHPSLLLTSSGLAFTKHLEQQRADEQHELYLQQLGPSDTQTLASQQHDQSGEQRDGLAPAQKLAAIAAAAPETPQTTDAGVEEGKLLVIGNGPQLQVAGAVDSSDVSCSPSQSDHSSEGKGAGGGEGPGAAALEHPMPPQDHSNAAALVDRPCESAACKQPA